MKNDYGTTIVHKKSHITKVTCQKKTWYHIFGGSFFFFFSVLRDMNSEKVIFNESNKQYLLYLVYFFSHSVV